MPIVASNGLKKKKGLAFSASKMPATPRYESEGVDA
jgi:hypothetical protein